MKTNCLTSSKESNDVFFTKLICLDSGLRRRSSNKIQGGIRPRLGDILHIFSLAQDRRASPFHPQGRPE
jgi:hypothetical protein